MPDAELAEFLGPVSGTAFSWQKLSKPRSDVYYGHAKPPLSGDVSFYLGGYPDFELPPLSKSILVAGKLGIFPIKWSRIVAKDGSVRQFASFLDSHRLVVISVRAHRQKAVDELVALVTRLPTFTTNIASNPKGWPLELAIDADATPQPVRIVGPCSTQLSATDVEQITITSNPSHERLGEIDAVRPDKVNVKTGTGTTWTRLTLVKRADKWIVEEKVVTDY